MFQTKKDFITSSSSGVIILDHIISKLLTLKKHRLTFTHAQHKLIKFKLFNNWSAQAGNKWCQIQANQICSPWKINKSTNVEWSTCIRNNKGMYSCFYDVEWWLFDVEKNDRPFIKWTSWKGNYILRKVHQMYSLLRKSPW